jgi:hypothetical protein
MEKREKVVFEQANAKVISDKPMSAPQILKRVEKEYKVPRWI